MIAKAEIYAHGRGFVSPADLSPGDQVYTLDSFQSMLQPLEAVGTDYVSEKLMRIDSGAHNALVSSDALMLYHSEVYGQRYLRWSEIPAYTRDKTYSPTKYLPVLSWPHPGEHKVELRELEHVARMCLRHRYDEQALDDILAECSGVDCQYIIDYLEHWCSESPGKGWFDRVQVKSRVHPIRNKHFVDELAKVAVLAGYTSVISMFDESTYALRVSYESMPIPGSRPKNEKYYREHYTGFCYTVNAGNKPVLGKSLGRVFYLPTSQINNRKE